MSFLDNFCKPKSVSVDFGDNSVEMFPSRVCMASELRTLFSDLGPDISIIFDDRSADVGTSQEFLQDDSEAGNMVNTKQIKTAADLETIQYRSDSRASAIRRLAENALEDRCKLAIGRILMDSMREEFPVHAKRPKDEVVAFMDHENMTVEVLVQLLIGWVKANSAKMGSLGKRMVSALETEAETETETKETPGSPSSTNSTEQSEPDTE